MCSWEVFWVFFYAFAPCDNAGVMREQVCAAGLGRYSQAGGMAGPSPRNT
jgi:hypothetical protein